MLRAHIGEPDKGPKQIGVAKVHRGGFSAKIIVVEKGFHKVRGPDTFSHREIAEKIHHIMKNQLMQDGALDPKLVVETEDSRKLLRESINDLTEALKKEFPEAEFQPHYEKVRLGKQGTKAWKLVKAIESFNKGRWKVELIKITSPSR